MTDPHDFLCDLIGQSKCELDQMDDGYLMGVHVGGFYLTRESMDLMFGVDVMAKIDEAFAEEFREPEPYVTVVGCPHDRFRGAA